MSVLFNFLFLTRKRAIRGSDLGEESIAEHFMAVERAIGREEDGGEMPEDVEKCGY